MLVCENLFCFFLVMKIDEERSYPLTNYSSKRNKKKCISSDHNVILAKFNLQFKRKMCRMPRKEIFDLKNSEGQARFFIETENNTKFKELAGKKRGF